MVLDAATGILIVSCLLALGVVGLVIGLSHRRTRRQREFLERISRRLGRLEPGVPLAVTHQGVAFQVLYTPGAQREPAALAMTLPTSSPETFALVKEGASDRFFKGAGISTEIQTGDAAFDQEVYIESDSPAFVRALLGTPDRRAAVREIFRVGFTRISQENGDLQATWEPFVLETPVEPATIQAMALHLAALRAAAAAAPGAAREAPGAASWKRRLSVAIAPGLIAIAAVVLDRYAESRFPPLDAGAVWLDSLKLAAAGLVVILFVAVVRLRGRSRAHRMLLARLVPLLFLLPFGAHGLTILLNAELDRSTPSTHTALVEGKHRSSGRWSGKYRVTVSSWRAPGQVEELPVSAGVFERISPGAANLVVLTHAGRFGYEWLADARPATVAEVISTRTAAVEAKPGDDRVFYERGLAYLRAGDPKRASDDFKKAVELNPHRAVAYRYVAWEHGQRGEYRDGIALLTALIELDPRDGEAYYGRAWNRNKLGDRDGALSDLTRACELGYAKACEVVRRATGK